ncbi:MAG: carboxylate--amine ligase, partial [Gemmatimonadota bacterium]|nr:carboxylate--amine ligase [Gemmatimonadota bacterium]
SALARTRVCHQRHFAPTADERLIDELLRLGPSLPQRGVLFPCEDTNVALVSRNREVLEPFYRILLPAPDVVEMLMDKVRFYAYAQAHDLSLPATRVVESEADVLEASKTLDFPCILKPRDSAAHRWEDQTVFKAFKIESAADLISTYRHFRQWTDCFIVQEWIEGSDSDLYSCNCYFDATSKPLATFVARKLRQWPPDTGVSCLGEEVRNDVVLDETLALFQGVGYHGLGYLEMKRDSRSGRMFIVEPNIGRPTGRSAIAEAGGVELLYTAYCDAVGFPLPESRTQRYDGVKWIHLRKDLQSAVQYWRRGELTPLSWWRSIRGRKAHALASWTDPMPFIFDWLAAARAFLSPRKRKKRATASIQVGSNPTEPAIPT